MILRSAASLLRRHVLAIGLLTATLAAGRAEAQPTLAQATEEQQQQARGEYQRGRTAYDASRYDEALAAFEASYAAVASPNSGLMIARCLAALERTAAAYRAYEDVVDMAAAWGNDRYAESADAARSEMAALKPRIATLMLDVQDASGEARLTVGETDVPRRYWQRAFATDGGNVTVTLSGPEGEQRRELSLEPGVAATVQLRPTAVPAERPTEPANAAEVEPGTAAPAAAPPAPMSNQPRSTSGSDLRVGAYLAGGTGVAALVAFAVLGSMANGRFDELEQKCPGGSSCDPALRAMAKDGKQLQTGANVALVAGGVLLATGATLFVLSLDDDDRDETQLAITSSGLHLRGAL